MPRQMTTVHSMPIRVALALTALLSLSAVWLWATEEMSPATPDTAAPSLAESVRMPASSLGGANLQAPAVSATPPSTPLSTYALVIQSQADRSPAIRAQARELIRACRAAAGLLLAAHRKQQGDIDIWAALDSRTSLPRIQDGAPGIHERRQQARERILTHCDTTLRDEHAQNHPSVRELDRVWDLDYKEGLHLQLQAQDFRGAVFHVLMKRQTPIAYFEGVPWGGISREGYARALYYAMALDPRPSTQISIQLSMAGECLESGNCDFDLDTLPLFRVPTSPAINAQARALAPRIFAAMKAVRMEAFLPPADMRR